MHYFIIRKYIDREPVGIVKILIPDHPFGIHTNIDETFVEKITQAEYETHQELVLFPGYGYHSGVFGEIVVFDPMVYKVKGHRVVKRGKVIERERRKEIKKNKGVKGTIIQEGDQYDDDW